MSIMVGLAIYFVLLMIAVPLLLCFLRIGRNEVEDELCFYEFAQSVDSRKQLNTTNPLSLKALAAELKVRHYIPRT
ncbi:hypothetical protein [Candidatus Albibeggiatoa sp. nov. NOAA]|uniref:hypothetical protein n=1 Tax=Candidatus Albibeggiatoa sp. nov. NOAA TaxID=3162724 RepID=UPI0032FF8F65|nr:hypothetical protein [Thiotrichaceae bacterium]